jgi:hypothetical protein
MVARGGGGVASPMMTRVHQDGQLVSGDGRAPPPYPTSAKLGARVSGGSHDHRNHHPAKMNPEERIKLFIDKLVQNRHSYAYRRNSGKILACVEGGERERERERV